MKKIIILSLLLSIAAVTGDAAVERTVCKQGCESKYCKKTTCADKCKGSPCHGCWKK